MVKEIIQYPTPLSVKYATDVRIFDEELFSLIDDLKDTIKENNLDGLAAFQIGNYFNVIVVKDDNGELIEMINPRLIAHSDKVTTEEKTAYYPNHSAKIQRYNKISVVYQDRNGKDCSMQATGKMAIVIQRKIDYTFGATFIQKMSKEEKEKFEAQLEGGIDVGYDEYCPTTFKRDYVLKGINIALIVMLLPVIASFFVDNTQLLEKMWNYQLYGSFVVMGMTIGYFFYGQYEGKIYTSCTSCQIGNIIGTCVIALIKLTLIMIASYFFINPS